VIKKYLTPFNDEATEAEEDEYKRIYNRTLDGQCKQIRNQFKLLFDEVIKVLKIDKMCGWLINKLSN